MSIWGLAEECLSLVTPEEVERQVGTRGEVGVECFSNTMASPGWNYRCHIGMGFNLVVKSLFA